MTARACAGRAPLFDATIHGETERQRDRRHAYALAICDTCPALHDCRASIDWRRDDGVLGGILLPTIPNKRRRNWRQP